MIVWCVLCFAVFLFCLGAIGYLCNLLLPILGRKLFIVFRKLFGWLWRKIKRMGRILGRLFMRREQDEDDDPHLLWEIMWGQRYPPGPPPPDDPDDDEWDDHQAAMEQLCRLFRDMQF